MGQEESRTDEVECEVEHPKSRQIRSKFSHQIRHPISDDEDTPKERLDSFFRLHNAPPKMVISMLGKRHDSIFNYLCNHGLVCGSLGEVKDPMQELADLHASQGAPFIDLYADALFQSGSNIKASYQSALIFKPGHSSVYVGLVIAYYLSSISSVIGRYGHQIHNIQEISSLTDIRRMLESLSHRGSDMIMATRAAIAECVPDLLRGYPTLSTKEFRNRNRIILGDPSAFLTPSDRAAEAKYEKCKFRYILDRDNVLQFALCGSFTREPEPPRQVRRAETREIHPPVQVPHVTTMKPKRSAFAVYTQRKYEEPAPAQILPAIHASERLCFEEESKLSSLIRDTEPSASQGPPQLLSSRLRSESELRLEPELRLERKEVPAAVSLQINLDDALITCPICMDARRSKVLGCGHFLCEKCAQVKLCPFCQKPILEQIKVYWS